MYDPDLQTFRLFLTVHDLGNITRAAERSNIAVSAVTKRLQDLEAHYHVRLFDRQPRGVRPTAAGDALAHDIRDLLARLDRLKGTMSEFAEGVRGHVRVHASASNILENLAEAIAEFTRTNPLIRIEVQEAMSWSIVRDVLEGRADIGLISASIEIPPSLTVHAYRTDQLVAVLPRNHLLAQFKTLEFDQLLDYEHVGIGANSALTVQLEEAAAIANRSIRYSYRVVSCEVARTMVGAGLGITVLPNEMVSPYEEASGICGIPLSDPWARRELRICMRNDIPLTVPASLFLSLLQQRRTAPQEVKNS
jgi:DNA-binding transcriptional LysR family regulator